MTKEDILKELLYLRDYKTPIHELERDKNNIYVKREDIIPFSFGGNKVRIAANYFLDLVEKEKDVVITYGASSSNLCRVIANMAARYGIKCVIVSPEDDYVDTPNSNLVRFLGASIVKSPINQVSETIDKVIQDYSSSYNPYFIYGGGHGELGAISYKSVLDQIVEYEVNNQINFDSIFITLATGTSMCGLVLQNKNCNYNKRLIGISVARKNDRAIPIFEELLQECGQKDINENDYHIIDKYSCGGYAKYDDDVLRNVQNAFMKNGLNLDTTYTGKGYTGMKKYLEEINASNKNVLFIHTGGTPLFFKEECRFLS